MDNEMIERVTKILMNHNCCNTNFGATIVAVAIIKAMREPTEKMKTVVTDDMVITDRCYYCGGHIDGWRTMIDSITND